MNYDILYLGNLPFKIESSSDNGIVKNNGIFFHAYLINKRLYSKYLNINIPEYVNKEHNDKLMYKIWGRFGIDFYVYYDVKKSKESYSLYPMLLFQDNIPPLKPKGKLLMVYSCKFLETFHHNRQIIISIIVFIIICGLFY